MITKYKSELMKNIFFPITCFVIIAVILISCGQQPKTTDNQPKKDQARAKPETMLLSAYLGLKNALIADDAATAAKSGNQLLAALNQMNQIGTAAGRSNDYAEMVDDIKENATHIAANADRITHQREHFESLSNDVNDLVDLLGAPQKLYLNRCPMYNNGKGAIWLSETKAIKNPYYGKRMLTCGAITKEY